MGTGARVETTVSAFPFGSGRAIDAYWPTLADYSKAVTFAWNSRVALSPSAGNINWSNTTGAGAGTALGIKGNIPCAVLTSDVGAVGGTGVQLAVNTLSPKPILVKGQNISPDVEDTWCTRIICNMAYNTIPAADADTGLELVCPANDVNVFILKDAVGGIGWTFQPDGHVALIVRGGLGLQRFPILTAGFDPLAFHSYELRILGATGTQDAVMRAFVDGRSFQSLSWGAGTVLPLLNAAYRQMKVELVNQQGGSQLIHVQRVAFQTSSSEAGIL